MTPTAESNGAGIVAALGRAGLVASPELDGLIELGLGRIGADDGDVLEVTRAFWQTDSHGGDGVAILTRETLGVVLAPVVSGFLRRQKSPPACVLIPLATVRDLIDDDEQMGGAVVFFFADPDFLLRFDRAAERDRFYRCAFDAQRRRFARWGMQLDPQDYVDDFARFYSELVATGIEDSGALSDWVEGRYGEFRIDNALGLAREWRRSELSDAAGGLAPSSRVMRLGHPSPWGDVPESRPVFVELGTRLFDAGMLDPPYDERSFNPDEPLRHLDAGPARLLATMNLAAYARELGDPRAEEFIAAAMPHLDVVPAEVFRPQVRELWADIAPLPAADERRFG